MCRSDKNSNLLQCIALLAVVALCFFMLARNAESAFAPTKNAIIGKSYQGKILTPSDVNMLEPACIMILAADLTIPGGEAWYVKLKGNPILDRPEYQIAKNAISFHHYCWAEVHMARYYSHRSDAERKAELLSAYNNYNFMVTNPQWLPQGWPYLPEMYVKLGNAATLMDRDMDAIKSFIKAMELNPNYVPAYTSIIEFMREKGNKAEALRYATEGLKHNSQSETLHRLYLKLGGGEPFPTPYPVTKDSKQDKGNAGEPNAIQQPGSVASKLSLPKITTDDRHQQSQPSNPSSKKDTYGTPTNPYCRFCP
jgi:tetratricopeptide (TPR) repeat protein